MEVAVGLGMLNLNALAQRLRDTGRSGWVGVMLMISGIGVLIAFILAFQRGQVGANKYGSDPLHDKLTGVDRR